MSLINVRMGTRAKGTKSGSAGGGASSTYYAPTAGSADWSERAALALELDPEAKILANLLKGTDLASLLVPVLADGTELPFLRAAEAYALLSKKNLLVDGIVSASAGTMGSIAASALGDLTDVTLSAIQNGHALVYENGQWVNKAIGGGAEGAVTALGVSGGYLTWTKDGVTNNLRVPYADSASALYSNGVIGDFNATINKNGIYAWIAETANRGVLPSYGTFLQWSNVSEPIAGTSQHWITQLASATDYNGLWIRTRTNETAWTPWEKILTSVNYSSIIDSRFVTLDTAQTITAGKTFTGYICHENPLMFKHASHQSGVYLSPQNNGSLDISTHTDYTWVATIASFQSSGIFRSFYGVVAPKFTVSGGTASHVLMADGSLQTHWKAADITSATADNGMITPLGMNQWTSRTFLKLSGGTMTGTLRIESQSEQPLWLNKIGSNGYIQIGNTGAEFGCYAGLGAYMQNDALEAAPTLCLNSNDLNSPKFRLGATFYSLWHEGNSRVKQFYTLDLSGYDSGTFYPVVWPTTYQTIECEVWSPNLGGADPYNCNRIHFLLRSNGWSDDGNTITILSRHNYDNGEITIGAIGRGNMNGYKAIWLRGGKVYRFQTDYIPSFSGGSWSSGNEDFTPGPNYWGGTNSNVNILWTNDGTRWERDLATLSSNVASATRLQGTYSLWGQSFYGNNVDGAFRSLTDNENDGFCQHKILRYPTAPYGLHTYIFSDGSTRIQSRREASDEYFNLILNPFGGNVGIGAVSPTYKLTVNGDIYATSGWLRTYGQNGLYFEPYGGGFHMIESMWIRTYNQKSFYTGAGIIRSDNCLQVGGDGSAFYANSAGTVRASGEIISNSANAFRAIQGNYGFFIRNDGSNTYFMFTNAGNQYGGWNHLRPLYISNISGDVTMEHNLEVRGNIMCKGVVAAAA